MENGIRDIYVARLSPTDTEIIVKFTRRYSTELHTFCAEQGFSPKLLGFERLPGGWFAVAMEKVDTVELEKVSCSSELNTWKKEIRNLVDDFHAHGLVHGDLRLENFIFAASGNRRKMLLVDFDWGGKAGEVEFPFKLLPPGLQREGDGRVFAETFRALDMEVAELEAKTVILT